jgi:protein arginine N-methyltransferase 3
MSAIHIQGSVPVTNSEFDPQSSSSEEEEETWDDWVSDSESTPCKSLFVDEVFPSAEAALQNDRYKYNFDLNATCSSLGMFVFSVEKTNIKQVN